jgi:hypothetical protein
LLNRSQRYRWGLLSNGLQLRLLHDNVSLKRAAYLEFDLESILAGESYAEFSLVWLLCHQSRIERLEDGACWLERWSTLPSNREPRAMDTLREGVAEALQSLGSGFLAANRALRTRLQNGESEPCKPTTSSCGGWSTVSSFSLWPRIGRCCSCRLRRQPNSCATAATTPCADCARSPKSCGGLAHRPLPPGAAALYTPAHRLRRAGLPALGRLFVLRTLHTRPRLARTLQPDAAGRPACADADHRAERAAKGRLPQPGLRRAGQRLRIAAGTAPRTGARLLCAPDGGRLEQKPTGSHYTPRPLVECLLDSALEPVVAGSWPTPSACGARAAAGDTAPPSRKLPSSPSKSATAQWARAIC